MNATIPPPPNRLLVFARLPELGHVKSRIAADLGATRALAVYAAMLRDALASIGDSSGGMEVEILWTAAGSVNGASLAQAFGDRSLAMQTGDTLGDRLSMAFSERFFFHRTQKIVAVGVDDPLLPRSLVEEAFALLDSCDWVIGPAVDGGYYLIGCRAAAFDMETFRGIEWGTSTVFAATAGKIAASNRNLAVLPTRRDLDTLDDLLWFRDEASHGELVELLRRLLPP